MISHFREKDDSNLVTNDVRKTIQITPNSHSTHVEVAVKRQIRTRTPVFLSK